MSHNGEINTLRGNINWMHARQAIFESDLFGDDIKKILPIINTDGSDSAMFDNCLELLVLGGRSLPHAVMMMIPEPWTNHESMSDEKKAFYEYHSCLMEPWDGPASIAFTDGNKIGAVLDRNGLRPSRYYVTKDDYVIMASEVGVLEVPPDRILEKGRLQPGRMFLIDTEQGRIVADEEIKKEISTEHPYRQWLDQHMVEMAQLTSPPHPPEPSHQAILQRQQAFGYTFEDLRIIMAPMARDGVEAVGSMGTDTPLAVLSDKPQPLYNYFKQLFAQVTNPPIDCIREEIITSAETTIGSERNLLKPEPESCRLIELKSPILTNEDFAKLKNIDLPHFKSATLPILFKVDARAAGLEKAMEDLCAQASRAIAEGINILILSDRGIDHDQLAVEDRRPGGDPDGQPGQLGQLVRQVVAGGIANEDGSVPCGVRRPDRHEGAFTAPPRLEQVLVGVERRRQWAREHRPQVRQIGQPVGLEAQRELVGHRGPMVAR
jgi:glutamate synthase (ferredoxin)